MMKINGKLTPALKAIETFYIAWVAEKNDTVHSHSTRVSNLAIQIGIKLRLSSSECKALAIAGHLHDMGKFILPEGLLLKTGKYTDSERALMQDHPSLGYKLVKRFTHNKIILDGVLEHHEKVDGSGYPSRTTSPSLFGQIVGVSDYFTARQEPRVYRPVPLTPEESMKATLEQPFNPEVLKAFLQVVGNGNGSWR